MSFEYHFYFTFYQAVEMDTELNLPIRSAIVHEVETAVSNTKQDLVTNMSALIESRLNTF
jgi:hypothetical protein